MVPSSSTTITQFARDYDANSPLHKLAFSDTAYYNLSTWSKVDVRKFDVYSKDKLKNALPEQIPTPLSFLLEKAFDLLRRDDALLVQYFPAATGYQYDQAYLDAPDRDYTQILDCLRDAFEDIRSKLTCIIVKSPYTDESKYAWVRQQDQRTNPTIYFSVRPFQLFEATRTTPEAEHVCLQMVNTIFHQLQHIILRYRVSMLYIVREI